MLTNAPEHILFTALLHLPGQEQLVEDEVCLLEVEDDVQLAHVAVIFIHLLHVAMYDLQCDELVIG